MGIEFRKAVQKDLELLQSLAKEVIDANYRPFLGDSGVEQFIHSGASDSYVKAHIDDCDVICEDGQIAGFAVCEEELIDLVMISEDARRQGLGSMLLQHCESRLFREFDEIHLESFEGNSQANDFYHKNRWQLTRCVADPESGVNKFVFTKRLNNGSSSTS